MYEKIFRALEARRKKLQRAFTVGELENPATQQSFIEANEEIDKGFAVLERNHAK